MNQKDLPVVTTNNFKYRIRAKQYLNKKSQLVFDVSKIDIFEFVERV